MHQQMDSIHDFQILDFRFDFLRGIKISVELHHMLTVEVQCVEADQVSFREHHRIFNVRLPSSTPKGQIDLIQDFRRISIHGEYSWN